MARAMNVSKRVTAGKTIVAKTLNHAERAQRMSEELMVSFGENRTPEGKKARDLARTLTRLSENLKRVHGSFAKAI